MIPSDKFYLTHSSNIHRLENILKDRSIRPLSLRKKIFKLENPGKRFNYSQISDYYSYVNKKDRKKYINSIFYGFLFPEKDGTLKYGPLQSIGSVHFIFSSKILEDNAKMYGCRGVNELPIFCEGWSFGNIHKGCFHYKCEESLETNLNKWRNLAFNFESYNTSSDVWIGGYHNEILLEGEMPLDLDLLAILTPKSKEVKNLKKKYPEYNWIHTRTELKDLIGNEIPKHLLELEKLLGNIKEIDSDEDSRDSISLT
jgi:hypothetical protein